MNHSAVRQILVSVLALLGTACAGVSPIYADNDAPAGALRVALAVHGLPRAEVLQYEGLQEALLASGVKDDEIDEHRVIGVAVHCCDGPDTITFGVAWAPPDIAVENGDVVEIRVGRGPEAEGLARLNVVTRIRQRHDADPSRCDWIPKQPGLWRRTIYCDWMPSEGWVEVRSWGLPILWMKPAP